MRISQTSTIVMHCMSPFLNLEDYLKINYAQGFKAFDLRLECDDGCIGKITFTVKFIADHFIIDTLYTPSSIRKPLTSNGIVKKFSTMRKLIKLMKYFDCSSKFTVSLHNNNSNKKHEFQLISDEIPANNLYLYNLFASLTYKPFTVEFYTVSYNRKGDSEEDDYVLHVQTIRDVLNIHKHYYHPRQMTYEED